MSGRSVCFRIGNYFLDKQISVGKYFLNKQIFAHISHENFYTTKGEDILPRRNTHFTKLSHNHNRYAVSKENRIWKVFIVACFFTLQRTSACETEFAVRAINLRLGLQTVLQASALTL